MKSLGLRIGGDIERGQLRVTIVLHNFHPLRYEDDWLAEAIAETIREEAGLDNSPRNTACLLESSRAMKLAGGRLRTSPRGAIARLDEREC